MFRVISKYKFLIKKIRQFMKNYPLAGHKNSKEIKF